ncbi:MAG: MBL fold metallo-hydrolase [Pyrinomonadaceae bacterium]
MPFKEAVPKDAAAVILLKDGKVFLARRNPKILFLGGWYAFPGGKVEAEDARIEVRNCDDETLKKFIVAAARETFEEIGVLLARGGDRITKGQRAALHDDLTSGRFSFAEILENWGLKIDAEDFRDAGFWTTPNFSPVRFKTRFLVAECPRRQEPQVFGEFINGDFILPKDALQIWENGEMLISPPVLITLQTLSEDFKHAPDERKSEKLLEQSQNCGGKIRHIKLNPFVTVFPVRTETLPPATHTNCFIVGGREFVVIDAASPFADEQKNLREFVDALVEGGNSVKSLIVTHLHKDHISGVNALQKHLKEKFNLQVPIAAQRLTAASLKGKIRVEKFIADDEIIELQTDSETFRLRALHTPGHARGHLCFYDERRGFLLSGDTIVGAGSVSIAPPEGNMSDYLESLERLKNLPNLRFLCGSHGAAMTDAKGKIETYIEHRLMRERKIIAAIENGASDVQEIVAAVYTDVAPDLRELAELSVKAHLEKINFSF